MVGRSAAIGGALLGLVLASGHSVSAQNDAERQTLRAQIEQRFDVLPVKDGIVLRPKRPNRTVRSIQVTGGDIALDGELVTGAELRQRLAGDADIVIRLSYLDTTEQRTLFSSSAGSSDAAAPAPSSPGSGPLPLQRFPRPPRPPRPPRQSNGSDRVRIGGGVQVAADEVVHGDVVAIGGGANIEGRVDGDVVCVLGSAELGPNADIGGDLTVVGGTLRRDPAARVAGSVNEIGWGDLRFVPGGGRGQGFGLGPFVSRSTGSSVFAIVSTFIRVGILFVLASVVFLFGRDYVDRVGTRAAAEPFKAGLVGVLIQLLFFPALVVTVIVMVITIIGIPLLLLIPFALLALGVLWMVGFAAVAQDVGRFVAARMGWQEPNPYLVLGLGILGLLSPVLIAGLIGLGGGVLVPLTWALLFVGFFIEYVAWTVGLGAVALLRFDR